MITRYDAWMVERSGNRRRLATFWKAVVEIGFIIFLFYANLLMGEFTRSSAGRKSLGDALRDIFTRVDFGIALVAALIGYVVFEFLRDRV